MALSLLCGGLGVAEASVHVDESGVTYEVLTKQEVTAELDKKVSTENADAKYAKANDVTANTKNIDTNKANITALQTRTTEQGKLIATNTANIANNTTAIEKKIDKELAETKLALKANVADVYSKTDANDKFATKEALNGKADKTTVTALEEHVGNVEGKVTTLENTVGNDSRGLVKDVNELKTQGNTLNNALGSKADKTDLEDATDRITANEGKITELQTKTQKIKHDVANDTTSVNGMKVGQQQVDMGGKNLTNVGTINGINLGEKEGGTYISQDGSIWGNMKNVDTQVGKNTTAITKLENKVGTVGTGTYLNPNETIGKNLGLLDTGLKQEVEDRIAADTALSDRIGTVTDDGKYIKKSDTNNVSENLRVLDTQAKVNADAIAQETADRKAAIGQLAVNGNYIEKDKNVSENLVELDTQAKTNADAIAQETADRKAAIGQLAVNGNYIGKDKNVSDNLVELDKQAKTNADAITETNQRTAGITRDDTRKETSIEGKVTVDTNGNIKAEGTITSNGLDARAGEIKTTGKVSAGDVSTGTLETTGNAKIGGDLTVNGKLNVDEISMKNDRLDLNGDQHHSATTITADGISNNAKVTDKNGVTTESKFTHDKEGSTTYAYQGDAANWKKSTSNVTADGVENVAEDSKGNNNTFTQTSTDTKNILKDKDGNTSTTRQDSKGIYGFAKDKDGNKSFTKQEGNRIAESVIGQDGKQTKSEMTSTDITNTAKDGTITNTAKNVTNEGTESVTNKVGKNEVKVSTDGVDIKAEDGKKITESVGTASRVVENDKITDKAADSTVTTEKGKGTTFGKEGSTGTTNIYGDSIKTGKINAEDTTTDKLTAGAAADANGGRLTVDAKDGVKGSYKSDKYTSKSYILANTLQSGVDNGKKPTDADFVGSRTDHYMEEDKAKLDETVKDAYGSNVTNKTSTGTVTTITDGTTTTTTEQGVKDITNTATGGTIKNDAKDIVNKAQDTITNTAGTKITDTAGDSTVTTENGKGTTFAKTGSTAYSTEAGAPTDTNIAGNHITTGRVDANELGVSDKDDQGNTAALSVKAGEGIKGSATDKDGNKTYTKVTATENSFQVQDKDGNIKNHQVNTKDSSENTITNGDKTNTVTSTADGTTFNNSKANTAFEGGTYKNTTIKGNTITTGKVTMDYADVMKDLGVYGNARVDKDMTVKGNTTLGEAGKDTTLTVNSKATFKEKATFENGAEVKNGLTVSFGESTFNDKVTMKNGLDVTGGVASDSFTVKGTDIKIDSSGINAGGTVISNVADGSISEGSKDAVNGGQLYQVKNDLEGKVNKVGANAAAMANLHPMEFDPDSKWNIAAAMGNYGSETATAIGAFYRPNEDVMVNFSTAFGTGENMVGGGVSVRLGKGGNKLSREESNALKAQVNDLTARMDALLSVLNPNMSKDFPDVPENHWAYEAVSRLAGNDIVQGYPDGEFHGDRTMTRYEMAEIIYNALSRGAEAERELVEEFKPELQAMAASEKATAERAQG